MQAYSLQAEPQGKLSGVVTVSKTCKPLPLIFKTMYFQILHPIKFSTKVPLDSGFFPHVTGEEPEGSLERPSLFLVRTDPGYNPQPEIRCCSWDVAGFKAPPPQPLPFGSGKRAPHQQYFSNSSATRGTFRHCFVLWSPVMSL